MILYRTFVQCDGDGCEERIAIGGIPNLNTIAVTVKNKGWGEIYDLMDDGDLVRRHYCPKCRRNAENADLD